MPVKSKRMKTAAGSSMNFSCIFPVSTKYPAAPRPATKTAANSIRTPVALLIFSSSYFSFYSYGAVLYPAMSHAPLPLKRITESIRHTTHNTPVMIMPIIHMPPFAPNIALVHQKVNTFLQDSIGKKIILFFRFHGVVGGQNSLVADVAAKLPYGHQFKDPVQHIQKFFHPLGADLPYSLRKNIIYRL